MPMGPSVWLVNSLGDAQFGIAPFIINQPYIQWHNGDPGSGGLANVIPDMDRQPGVFERIANGVWRTAGAPIEVLIDIAEDADTTVSHISIWDSLDSGNWASNLIANQPIPVVRGDLFIVSDNIEWTIPDWIA